MILENLCYKESPKTDIHRFPLGMGNIQGILKIWECEEEGTGKGKGKEEEKVGGGQEGTGYSKKKKGRTELGEQGKDILIEGAIGG